MPSPSLASMPSPSHRCPREDALRGIRGHRCLAHATRLVPRQRPKCIRAVCRRRFFRDQVQYVAGREAQIQEFWSLSR